MPPDWKQRGQAVSAQEQGDSAPGKSYIALLWCCDLKFYLGDV